MAVEEVIAKLKELLKPLSTINLNPAKNALENLGKSLKDFGKIVSKYLEWAWFNVLAPFAEWTIEKSLPKLISSLSSAFKILSGVLKSVGKYVAPVIDFLSEMAIILGDTAWTIVDESLKALADNIYRVGKESLVLSDAEKELARQAEAAARGFRDMQAATEEQEDSINKEMDRITLLWKELDKLVDAEGRVQESDKKRVEYILGELNRALGTEYTMVGNIIQNYQGLRGEIEKVIAAKRANLLLDAHSDDYTKALEEQTKAWKSVELTRKEAEAALEQYQKVAHLLDSENPLAVTIAKGVNAKYLEKLSDYHKAQLNWAAYASTISEYEEAQRLISEENYDAATKLLLGQNTAYEQHANVVENETDRVKAALENEVDAAKSAAEQAKLGFEMGIVGFGQGLVDETQKAVQEAEKALADFNKKLSIGKRTIYSSNIFGRFGLSVPNVPFLAQGTVIPPNAPFMAVLGDQRHGTNIEAPLSTIQEAVAEVMADYEASNLAGHEATVEVLRQLLSAVLGIEIGDTTIGQAANRWNSRMAITRGGA